MIPSKVATESDVEIVDVFWVRVALKDGGGVFADYSESAGLPSKVPRLDGIGVNGAAPHDGERGRSGEQGDEVMKTWKVTTSGNLGGPKAVEGRYVKWWGFCWGTKRGRAGNLFTGR